MSRNLIQKVSPLFGVAAFINILMSQAFATQYTLEEAVVHAQWQDPWITGSLKRQAGLQALSIEAGVLPEPSVNFGIANLPVDTFDFSQEGMTQFRFGISQLFPRGETLSLRQDRLESLSQGQPFARENRNADVAVSVAQLWLDAYRNEATIKLIEQDRSLFEHLVDVAQSSYITAFGRTRQQDLIRAQLELTRLDDRLIRLHQQREMALAKLGEWLSDVDITLNTEDDSSGLLALALADLVAEANGSVKLNTLTELLNQHPRIKSIDQRVQASEAEINLAKQGYKPQWGLSASYGYRAQTPLGEDRSALFSVGMSFDVPLFTASRQDQKVQAAMAEHAVVKTERALALRQLKAAFETAEASYLRLLERKVLFDSRLIKDMVEQAEASLSAYTNDDGDFAEVVRARIAELNARIEALNVDVDLQTAIAQLNYFQAAYPSNEPMSFEPKQQQEIYP